MKPILIANILFLSLFLFGCKKSVPGCTDPNAENYDVTATENAGTCSYRGSAVFYHDGTTAQNLINDGITNVKLYVDGVFMDAMSPNVSFSFVPTCGHPDAMNMENYGIGNQSSQNFTYSIKDQNNVVLAGGTFQIIGNQCNAIEYNY